ncbi:NADPH:quinone oxidoreductase family protein [Desulfotignum phosphitoxidans]|nr:NADPH:quinone oxidoreductase family protein [Desulfotignum phosphitoxidans]
MLAWQIPQYGKFEEVLNLASFGLPDATSNSALIRVEAVGLNFLDILAIAGKYQEKGPLPFIPGIEAAGRVVESGPESPFAIGDKVMTIGNAACAEYMAAGSKTTFFIPGGMSYEEAAAFQLIYQTAHVALAHRAMLKADEWLLVHAGAGGVGTAAIQVGRALGARVAATAGSDKKLDTCRRAGAELAINYRKTNFCQSIREITDGRGADVIFDPVGGDVFEESTKCTAFEGRIITIGYASGQIPSIALNRILLKNMDVIGLFWGNYRQYAPQRIRQTQAQLNHLWRTGKIKPVIFHQFAFEDLPEALAALAGRQSFGKVVLKGPPANS